MAWIRNPLGIASTRSAENHSSAESENHIATDEEAAVVAEEKTPESTISTDTSIPSPRQPTQRLSTHQILYIAVMHGLGAMILSGGINFALSYAMYTTQDVNAHPIRLFELPNTLAGDAAVTIIVQCIVTWLVEFLVVTGDIRNGKLAPIGFIAPPTGRFARWFTFLDAQEKAAKPGRAGHWPLFVVSQALRGFLVSVVACILLWGPSMGILTTVGVKNGGDWDFATKWAPEIFKLILGGVLGLFSTPFMAMFWMVRAGWSVTKTDG